MEKIDQTTIETWPEDAKGYYRDTEKYIVNLEGAVEQLTQVAWVAKIYAASPSDKLREELFEAVNALSGE